MNENNLTERQKERCYEIYGKLEYIIEQIESYNEYERKAQAARIRMRNAIDKFQAEYRSEGQMPVLAEAYFNQYPDGLEKLLPNINDLASNYLHAAG